MVFCLHHIEWLCRTLEIERDPLRISSPRTAFNNIFVMVPAFSEPSALLRSTMTRGEVLRYAVTFALMRSRKIIRGLKKV